MLAKTRIEILLTHAEQEQRCVIMPSHKDRCALIRRLNSGEVVRPARGLYARASYWLGLNNSQRLMHMVRALQQAHPKWIFTDLSAVCIHELDHDFSLNHYIVSAITTSHDNSKHCPIWMRYRYDHDTEYEIVNGVRVTTLARTVAECLCAFDFCNGMQVCNNALRKGATIGEITRMLESLWQTPAHAWRVIEHASERCTNGGESRAYAAIIEGGLQVPQLQRRFYNEQSHELAFTDYSWTTEHGIIVGELDGKEKYTNPEMTGGRSIEEIVDAERAREQFLYRCGVSIIVRFREHETHNLPQYIAKLRDVGVPLARCS